jgi:hypothetical protein
VVEIPSTVSSVLGNVADALTFGYAGATPSPQRVYVAGPRARQRENITNAELDTYRQEGEALYGRYVPGGLFSSPRFIPGTERQTLPWFEVDVYGVRRLVGYVDENGLHRYPDAVPGSQESIMRNAT